MASQRVNKQSSNLLSGFIAAIPLIGVSLLVNGSAWAGSPSSSETQLNSVLQNSDGTVIFNPPGDGAPSQTRGGASRGDAACARNPSNAGQQFTALTPTSTGYGLTLSEHPTFFAYIPPTSAQEVFFNLKDENGQVYYQTTLPVPTNGGIVRFRLPETVPPLEIGKQYQWGAAILCSGRLRPDSPFVSSWVQRTEVSADTLNQLHTDSLLDRAALYGAHGIWYDVLATLADLQVQQPGNATLSATWENLLSAVGLEAVASTPFVINP